MSPPGAAAAGVRVAVLQRRGKFLIAEPFFSAGPRQAVSRERSAGVGDLVLVRPSAGRRDGRGGRLVIARRLGRADRARDVIEALMVDRGLRRRFDPAVEHEAREAGAAEGSGLEAGSGSDGGSAPGSGAARGRRDLRRLATFTIDPASARDFDDAVSAHRLDSGGWRVWVHIADVCAYVAGGTLLDREAYRRATSVYVPGAVEPMLPAALSNQACSLVPGQDRLAVSVEFEVRDGEVSRPAFHRSVIRSDARLEYGRVDAIFAGTQRAQAPWAEALEAARAAAATLARRREREGGLVLESSEPEFTFDAEGHVTGAEPVAQTESHRLIEHLMIAANEQVAALLAARRVPTLYRVHERPDAQAAERLITKLASLDVPTPPLGDHLTPAMAARTVAEASRLLERWLARTGRGRQALTSLVLRSLKQAYYEHRNLGHAGLGLSHYCHFTSPIRRYPDVICHRALLSVIAGGVPPDASWVAAAGPWASAREREAMVIERDADDIALCFLLERVLFHEGLDAVFEGEVVGLHSSGAFVAFGQRREFEGMLPVRRMRGDWWELSQEETMLVGTRGGGRIRLGDPLAVRVARIDAPRGRVDLLPAWED